MKPKSRPIPQPKNFCGPRVRLARAQCQPPLTLTALADRLRECGVPISPRCLGKIERRQRKIRDYELLVLAYALGVTMDWLLQTPVEN